MISMTTHDARFVLQWLRERQQLMDAKDAMRKAPASITICGMSFSFETSTEALYLGADQALDERIAYLDQCLAELGIKADAVAPTATAPVPE